MLGCASSKTKQHISASVRDAEHINLFIEHQKEVDFLQIDGKQEKKLRSSVGKHVLCKYGLESKVFSAKTLQETLEKVAQFE